MWQGTGPSNKPMQQTARVFKRKVIVFVKLVTNFSQSAVHSWQVTAPQLMAGAAGLKNGVMMRMTILALTLICWMSLAGKAVALQQEAQVPADVTYRILQEETIPNVKRSVDVRLSRRVSADILRAIAHEITAKDNSRYRRTFILYYLPEMEVGAGAWASSHFNPELQIEIYGTTSEEHAALVEPSESASARQVIGVWLDERPYFSRRIALYRKDGKVFMESTYRDGSVGTDEMTERNTNRGLRFDVKQPSPSGDYYVLNRSGDLEIRDSDGLIARARKLNSK